MSREKAGTYDVYASLRERFPGKEAINIVEACELLGIERKTAYRAKNFPKRKVAGRYIVPLIGLARMLG